MKIRVEVFLVEKRSPVEPLELLAAGVVLPVSAGNAQEFESADLAGMRNVWPAAEVNEFALTIKAEGRILLQVIIDVFNLVSLAQVLAESSGFRSGPFKAFERLCLGDDACHFFFDAREVGFGERRIRIDVIVKSIFNRRPERQLYARKEPQNGTGHDMRAAMAEDIQRFPILVGEDLKGDGTVAGRQFSVEIDDRAIDLGGNGCLRKAFTDPLGNFTGPGPFWHFFRGSIGQA